MPILPKRLSRTGRYVKLALLRSITAPKRFRRWPSKRWALYTPGRLDTDINRILDRSAELDQALLDHLAQASHNGFLRSEVTATTCGISLEHAKSIRLLIAAGNPTSAAALMRPQFEGVTRAMWFHFAASDEAVAAFAQPLTPESERSMSNSPSMKAMLSEIERTAPVAANQMLTNYKDQSWKAMNSFIHGGIHPVFRFDRGYPSTLLIQVVRNSNGLSVMAAMILALMSGEAELARGMNEIQVQFRDCLPPLLLQNPPPGR